MLEVVWLSKDWAGTGDWWTTLVITVQKHSSPLASYHYEDIYSNASHGTYHIHENKAAYSTFHCDLHLRQYCTTLRLHHT